MQTNKVNSADWTDVRIQNDALCIEIELSEDEDDAPVHQNAPPILRYERRPIVESLIVPHEKYSVLYFDYIKIGRRGYQSYTPPPNTNISEKVQAYKNDTVKYLVISFDDYFGFTIVQAREQLEEWKSLERGWKPEKLPISPFANGCHRIQVWKAFLPVPSVHYKQVAKRLPFLELYKGVRQWFERNARGTMPRCPDAQLGRNWCKTCGNHFMGYPVQHHKFQECPIRKMDPLHVLMFMAVNSPAYCNLCGSRSAYHEKCPLERPCQGCGHVGHQSCQKLCDPNIPDNIKKAKMPSTPKGIPLLSSEQQKEIVNSFRRIYLLRIKEMLAEGELEYWIHSDNVFWFYQERAKRENKELFGWGIYIDEDDEVPAPWQPWKQYPKGHYRGLVFPEADSARTNPHPVFLPNQMDFIEQLADDLDMKRFGQVQRREGICYTYVTMEQFSLRAKLRAKIDQMVEQMEGLRDPGPLDFKMEDDPELVSPLVKYAKMAQEKKAEEEMLNMSMIVHDTTLDKTIDSEDFNRTIELYGVPGRIYVPLPIRSQQDQQREEQSDDQSSQKATSSQSISIPKKSKWFLTVLASGMSKEEEELKEEQIRKRSEQELKLTEPHREVKTDAEFLEWLAKEPFFNSTYLLVQRIRTLTRALTGEGLKQSVTDCSFKTLQGYVILLHGAVEFVHQARSIQKEVSVSFHQRTQDVVMHKHGHALFIPTILAFRGMGARYWYKQAEENWTIQLAGLNLHPGN